MAVATQERILRETRVTQDGRTNIDWQNLGDFERWASLIGGTALGALGVARGGFGGLAVAAVGGALVYRGATGHSYLYQALGISTAGKHSPQASIPATHGVKLEESVTILSPPEDLYRFWRNLENLPRIMSHLDSVECIDERRSHWVAKGPLGVRLSWDAEIISERDNELIGWRSLRGSTVDTAGSVHFAGVPGDGGTEVRVVLKYDPPAGRVGAAIARMFGEAPEQQIREDLRRFKQMMEEATPLSTEG
jgi:uncharacterized membrane protein